MNLSVYFLVALVLSFLGTIPIGLITLTITQKTIKSGRNAGLMIALGATVMEFSYTFIALTLLDFFTKNTAISQYIKIAATVVFLTMGIYFLIKKSKSKIKTTSKEYNYMDFFRGVTVGMMNLLIIPFWIFLGIWLEAHGLLFERMRCVFSFSAGAAIGAFLAFLGYILLSEYIVTKTKTIDKYTNKAVGFLFLGLGVYQAVQFF